MIIINIWSIIKVCEETAYMLVEDQGLNLQQKIKTDFLHIIMARPRN
jgi:hypothetical protein